MRLRLGGSLPLSVTVWAARVGVIGLAAVSSGCASDKQPNYVNGPPSHMVAEPHARVAPAKVIMEEDGMPAQAPGRRMRPEEDDPSQPWSPNYGKGVAPKPLKSPPRLIEAQAPPLTPTHTAATRTEMSDVDADRLIARAIAAHEMRRQ
jgi:hypothetical protein